MQEHDIKQRLAEANKRLDSAVKALAPKHKGGEWEEYHSALQATLVLERQLAGVRGDEYAVPLAFPVRWEVGDPMPHVVQNDYKCLLIFRVAQPPDPNFDGSYTAFMRPRDAVPESLALVEFQQVISAKLGSPNDEVFEGHPLSGRGLESYAAQEVINSRWVRDVEAINSVHLQYNSESWKKLHHYIFWFHDTTFECLAKGFEVELFDDGFPDVLARACKRLMT